MPENSTSQPRKSLRKISSNARYLHFREGFAGSVTPRGERDFLVKKAVSKKAHKRSSFEGIHLLPAGAMYHNRKIKRKERREADRWRTGEQLHGQPLVKVTTNYERSQGLGGARASPRCFSAYFKHDESCSIH